MNLNVAKKTPASSCLCRQAKLPVLLQAQYVSTGLYKVGTFLDLGSTDNYVTYKFARKHNLQGKDINIEVEGIGCKKSYIQSKVYTVPIIVRGQVREMECYDLEVISLVSPPPTKASYAAMCAKFRILPKEVKRPS